MAQRPRLSFVSSWQNHPQAFFPASLLCASVQMQQKLKLTNFRQCLDIFRTNNNNSRHNNDSNSKIRRRIAVTWTGWQWSEYEYESTVIVRRVFGSIVRALAKVVSGFVQRRGGAEGGAGTVCCTSSAWASFHQPTTPKGPQLVQLFAFSCSVFLALFGLWELETRKAAAREEEQEGGARAYWALLLLCRFAAQCV